MGYGKNIEKNAISTFLVSGLRHAQYLRLPRIVPNFEILKKKMKKDAIETYANVVPMQKPAEIRCFLKSQHKKTSQFILCTASERRRLK